MLSPYYLLPLSIFPSTSSAQIVSPFTPSGNYTPTSVSCPHTPLIRPASMGLSQLESDWLIKRRYQAKCALETYLDNVGVPGLDVKEYISTLHNQQDKGPVIAFSYSGGGTTAQLTGLGLYQAFDGRVEESVKAKTGGLLQATTYITGLSGGAVATGQIAAQSYPTLQELIDNGNFEVNINQTAFQEIATKAEQGFPVTFTDLSAVTAVLSTLKVLDNQSYNPLSLTWSGFQADSEFEEGLVPMPIVLATEVIPDGPGSNVFQQGNTTVFLPAENTTTYYEITPFEVGSWTGRVRAFTPTQYFGSSLSDGQPIKHYCTAGYDTFGFMTGISMTAINFWYAESLSNGTVGQFSRRHSRFDLDNQVSSVGKTLNPYPPNEAELEQQRIANASASFVSQLPEFAELLDSSVDDILYAIVPNPFANYSAGDAVSPSAQAQKYLFMVDGSEGGQNNPLWPLIQPERKVDFIVVADGSGTELSSGWMNGTSLYNAYVAAQRAGLPFPKIPQVNTILNRHFTSRPTFFGCHEDTPLILYTANYPYTAYTNISFTAQNLTKPQIQNITSNALYLISQDSDRLAANWTQCLACAAIYKSLQRVKLEVPQLCQLCFDKHCWDGNEDLAQPSFLEPEMVMHPGISWDEWNATWFSS